MKKIIADCTDVALDQIDCLYNWSCMTSSELTLFLNWPYLIWNKCTVIGHMKNWIASQYSPWRQLGCQTSLREISDMNIEQSVTSPLKTAWSSLRQSAIIATLSNNILKTTCKNKSIRAKTLQVAQTVTESDRIMNSAFTKMNFKQHYMPLQ